MELITKGPRRFVQRTCYAKHPSKCVLVRVVLGASRLSSAQCDTALVTISSSATGAPHFVAVESSGFLGRVSSAGLRRMEARGKRQEMALLPKTGAYQDTLEPPSKLSPFSKWLVP